MSTHHTKDKGDLALSFVIYDLTRKGYHVLTPLSEHLPYDLVADHNGSLIKIQVKMRANGILPAACSWSDKNGSHRIKIKEHSFDMYALVNNDASKVAYCPISMIGKTITFEKSGQSRLIYWWEDFQYLDSDVKTQMYESLESFKPYQYIPRPELNKIEWPSNETLKELLWTTPTTQVAQSLGVTDTAIYRHCKRNNIMKPPRGYWTKA